MPGRDELSRKLAEPRTIFELKWWLLRRFKGRRSDREIRQFRRCLERLSPSSIVIDCGANVGLVTTAAAKHGALVHAFEPDPVAFETLVDRVGRYPNVKAHMEAVGIASGSAPLFVSRTRTLAATICSSLISRSDLTQASVPVEVIDLPGFISGFQYVDVLKLDIEGGEFDIIERMLDLRLDKKVGTTFVETHERFSSVYADRLREIRRRIRDYGIANIDLDWI